MKFSSLLFTVFVCCFTTFASAQNRPAPTTEQYNDNVISISYTIDTIVVVNPETGEEEAKIIRSANLTQLNSEQIYYNDEASEPIGGASQSDLGSFVQTLLVEELAALKQARIYIQITLIVDKNGKLAYFKADAGTGDKMSAKDFEVICDRMEKKLSAVKFSPAQKDSRAVPYGKQVNGF